MHIISRFKNITILLLVPVLSAVLFTTCEKSDVAPSLSVAETTVPYAAGSTTVSVTASGNWLLAVYFDAGVRPWATLSTGQGEGSRDGIVLEYDENSSEDARTTKIVLTESHLPRQATHQTLDQARILIPSRLRYRSGSNSRRWYRMRTGISTAMT